MYLASHLASCDRYRFWLSRTPRMTAGVKLSLVPANTIGYSQAANGNSIAINGTELVLPLNA